MASIRWIRNVLIDQEPCTIEIMIGVRQIADRCYVRVEQEPEVWFNPGTDVREEIIEQGISLLKQQLQNHAVHWPDGRPFDWT